MKYLPAILLLLFLSPALLAQKKGSAKTDSLLQVLQTTRQDTTRVRTLNVLAQDLLQKGKSDTALELSSSALQLSRRIGYTRGEADSHFILAQAHNAKTRTKEALGNYETALTLYQQLKRTTEEAETYYAMGMLHRRSNYNEAHRLFLKALQAAQQSGEKNLIGKTAYIIAVVLLQKGDWNEAPPYTDLAIKNYRETGNETGLGNCYVASARIHKHRGNLEQSLKDNYAALRLFEKTGNMVGIYNVHTGIGLIYLEQKNLSEALKSYLASKVAAEQQERKEVLSGAYNNIGNTYLAMEKMDKALEAFTESLYLAELTGDKKGVATAKGNIGIIHHQAGRLAEALQTHRQATTLFEEIGAKESIGIAYMEMGRVYFGLNKPEESRGWLGKALKMASQIDDKDVLSKGYHLLSQVDSAAGDYGSALKNYQKHVAYRDSLANDEAARHMIEQRLQYAFSKKEDSLRLEQALIAEKLDKQTLLSKQQQQELRLQQAALALAQREKDVQLLRFLKAQAELQLSNEQQEKKLALAAQEKSLQHSELEKQTLLSRQKEQALLLKDKELSAQRSQRDFWIAGAAVLLLFSFFIYRNYHQKQKANRLLQRQNIELEDQRDQTRKALAELQQTQLQLVQKEKMASLGELTSGIAHEIRNPLNFVNNFSELNEEVLQELKLQLGTLSLTAEQRVALQVVTDELLHNHEKISWHGKRADAIVKNMLLHARTSDGEKEPTDINALVDEYLRLSYQGFRTRADSPAVTLETHFDKSAGWVNVIPQDLSRVLVNLFNNAFYAVAERKKNTGAGFEPTVSVSTKKERNSVLITVKDNGTGIPEKITAKVFQPFFTTKPAGEGTGLGLSMSYDVVTKGHSGEMKVASREGEGAEFTIQLPA